ncbi:MAG: hypothetical protein M1839_005399 [Geoglossum umbratile]|nr:MAG: hypothetical protein M1839_005399 [Geoglossum umbratile]
MAYLRGGSSTDEAKLKVFTDLEPRELGTPAVHCMLGSSRATSGIGWQNLFAAVQLCFGDVKTSELRNSDNFEIAIAEDKNGWSGRSPLVVSFLAPTWVVLQEPHSACVAFGIQATPMSTMAFAKTLNTEMKVYETILGDENNVHITKHRPNLSGHVSVCGSSDFPKGADSGSTGDIAHTTLSASVAPGASQITSFTNRVNLRSKDARSNLESGASVETHQVSPFGIDVVIGRRAHTYHLHFPTPVLLSRTRMRIARKSSYIEVTNPVVDPSDLKECLDFVHPLFMSAGHPVLWNFGHINLQCQPRLDDTKISDCKWLVTHTSLMFSKRERDLREKSMGGANIGSEARVDFKDSLFSLFMHSTGLQGERARVFGINHPTGGGVHIMIFVSRLLLDLASHTVVLDAAALPLTNQLLPRIHGFLAAITNAGFCNIKVDENELKLWKHMIPAFVERCRQWKHQSSCEYVVKSKIPLSVDPGQSPICSCGNGKLPANFITGVPKWNQVSNYAVRVAISPSFPSLFEKSFTSGDIGSSLKKGESCKKSSGDGKGLLKCGRCREVAYCSKQCQRANWKEHKKSCHS